MDSRAVKQLESELWESADLLRAGSRLTSQQYCMPVLGLIFLRYAYSRFKRAEAEIREALPVRNGQTRPMTPADFQQRNALFLPEEARYLYLYSLPEDISTAHITSSDGHEIHSLGEAVNHAMDLVEKQSSQLAGILPHTYTIFSDQLLSDLLRVFNNSALDDVGGDVIGRIYEYFLSKFAPAVASDDGVFFTPKSLVRMIVNVLEPVSGTLLDCACGSGGMFVQSGDFVSSRGKSANRSMTFYGQEKVEYNAQLCLMNMAIHGLDCQIASGDEGNTFYHDAHGLVGKCDYVMANPPFNVDKVKAEGVKNAGRLPFGLPAVNKAQEVGNANYLWISYFYAYLNDHGRAGFVMASSATDSQGKDRGIREQLIRTGHVDVLISVGNNFFYTKSLPCSLWFFDRGKRPELSGTILFLDARNYYTVVDRTLNEWSEWQLKNLTAIIWLYRGEADKFRDLLGEYHDAVANMRKQFPEIADRMSGQSFGRIAESLADYAQTLRERGKDAAARADRRSRKKVQAEWDGRIAEAEAARTVVREAVWLTDRFGDRTGPCAYRDIPGLCRAAGLDEIEAKGWSLTPGAYVGVAPVEDDGVDFQRRMREIHRELLDLQAESNALMDTISRNFDEMGI